MSERLDAFVVCAPGLEQLVLEEVVKLGARPASATHGGVHCGLTWPQLWGVHLRSRVATRVLVRLARFKADGFDSLMAGLARIDWASVLPAGGVQVTASADSRSGLYHSGAIEERVADFLRTEVGRDTGDQSVLVRVQRDDVTISLDATGRALHQRGYRGEAGKAPIRETLAAALVMASGWDAKSPLIDPFCGSGTILIEAALIARRMAPGRHREFQFMQWPSFDQGGWERLLKGHDGDVLERCPVLLGSDRDAGAIDATLDNAQAAGVGGNIEVVRRTVSDLVVPSGKRGWVVANPPYGVRVGGHVAGQESGTSGGDLRDQRCEGVHRVRGLQRLAVERGAGVLREVGRDEDLVWWGRLGRHGWIPSTPLAGVDKQTE